MRFTCKDCGGHFNFKFGTHEYEAGHCCHPKRLLETQDYRIVCGGCGTSWSDFAPFTEEDFKPRKER